MQKAEKIIFIFSIITNVILLGLFYLKDGVQSINSNNYIEKIDSLELEISQIEKRKDSIRLVIDTIEVSLNNNDKHYKEVKDSILNNNVTDDYLFFINYLASNRERLDSVDNF